MKNPIVGVLIFFVIGLLYGQYFAPWAYTVLFLVISIALVYSLLNKNIIGIFLYIQGARIWIYPTVHRS